MVLWLGEDGRYHEEIKPCPYASGEKVRSKPTDGCQPKGRLRFLVWELVQRGLVGEVWLETGSVRDIQNIELALNGLWATPRREGLLGIPFILRRVPGETSYVSPDGTRRRVSKYFVELEPAAEYMRMRLSQIKDRVLLQAPVSAASERHEDYDEDDVYDDDAEADYLAADAEAHSEAPVPEGTHPAAMSRPYPPEVVREGILQRAAKYKHSAQGDDTAGVGFRGIVTGLVEGLFAAKPREQRPMLRHTALAFFFGQPSIKELPNSALKALLDWAGEKSSDGTWVPNGDAVSEAAQIVAHYEATQGQLSMGIEE
jgi:hypothetical protein